MGIVISRFLQVLHRIPVRYVTRTYLFSRQKLCTHMAKTLLAESISAATFKRRG